MGEGMTGSTVPRRQLGRYLRDQRNRSRLTIKAAALKLEWSEAKIWRIESGQTSLRSHDVAAMCEVYGAPPDLTEALKGLAKETKARGWWHSYGDVIPEGFDVYIGLEEAASQLDWYESELVPGLLQTEDYARALVRARNPSLDDDQVAPKVRLRIARQALLTRVTNPPKLDVVLNEAILRRPVGGDKVMAGQLERLIEASGLPNVSIKVIPFAAGLHHGVWSRPFVILRFPRNGDGTETEPPTVYVEGFTGDLYLDKSHEIDRYTAAFKAIRASSLNETASRDFIHEAARSYVP
jgi:transcriptional regulator with XRE-family HTH domain